MSALFFAVPLLVLAVGLAVRNELVYLEMSRYLDKLSAKAQADIGEQRPWRWRYEEYEKVSQHKAILKFWIPVRKMFDGCKALEDRFVNTTMN